MAQVEVARLDLGTGCGVQGRSGGLQKRYGVCDQGEPPGLTLKEGTGSLGTEWAILFPFFKRIFLSYFLWGWLISLPHSN